MFKRKRYYILLLVVCLFASVIAGCGKKTAESQTSDDSCITVELPEDIDVGDIFSFKNKHQVSITGAASIGISDGVINVGTMENGNSIVWRSNSNVFVHVIGKNAEEISNQIAPYASKLNATPISYDEFKKSYNEEIKN